MKKKERTKYYLTGTKIKMKYNGLFYIQNKINGKNQKFQMNRKIVQEGSFDIIIQINKISKQLIIE